MTQNVQRWVNWRVVMHSVIAAAIGGALTSVVEVLSHGQSGATLHELGNAALIGALIGTVGYLRQSPIQPPASKNPDADHSPEPTE